MCVVVVFPGGQAVPFSRLDKVCAALWLRQVGKIYRLWSPTIVGKNEALYPM